MQSSKKESPSSNDQNFSPFVIKTIKVQGTFGFFYESACYYENHNMIIACPSNKTIEFYNATTFEPQEGRKVVKLNGFVTQISYQPETDTFLLGCSSGIIYEYNVSKNELKTLKWYGKGVRGVAFLDSTFYAFSLFDSRELCVGVLYDNENVYKFDLNSSPSCGLHQNSKRNLLFTSLDNGFVRIYWTNKLPYLKAICSAQTREHILTIRCVNMKGKEYVLTSSANCTMKIWHLVKGRMRLLKVVYCECTPHSIVYLENYKMIAIGYHANYVKFFRFPCMELKRTVDLREDGAHFLFLMKEKNMIGVTTERNLIEIIQLG